MYKVCRPQLDALGEVKRNMGNTNTLEHRNSQDVIEVINEGESIDTSPKRLDVRVVDHARPHTT